MRALRNDASSTRNIQSGAVTRNNGKEHMGKRSRRNLQPSARFTRSLRHGRRNGAKGPRHHQMEKAAQVDVDALHSAFLSLTLLAGKLRLARKKRPMSGWTKSDFEQF